MSYLTGPHRDLSCPVTPAPIPANYYTARSLVLDVRPSLEESIFIALHVVGLAGNGCACSVKINIPNMRRNRGGAIADFSESVPLVLQSG